MIGLSLLAGYRRFSPFFKLKRGRWGMHYRIKIKVSSIGLQLVNFYIKMLLARY